MRYPFIKPIFISPDELQHYFKISKNSGFLSNNGPLVRMLEEKIAELIGTDRYVVLYSSATTALIAALSWAKHVKGPKAKVVSPSFTFPATLQAVIWNNLPFAFCDISDDDLCIDCNQLEAMEPFDIILVVNALSGIGDLDEYLSYAHENHKLLIFDSASCFGNTYRNVPIGNFGDIEVFSFHASKVFPFGECGAITCADEDAYNYLKRFNNFGFDEQKNISSLGLNAKVSELTAAYGLCILDRFSEIRRHRIYISSVYENCLPADTIVANPESDNRFFVRQLFPIRFKANVPIDAIQNMLKAEGVMALRYYKPLHHYDCFRVLADQQAISLPRTESAYNEMICLPLTYDMEESDIRWICKTLEQILHQFEEDVRL